MGESAVPRICVVGAGDWSTRMHLPAMRRLQEGGIAEYAGVCDLDEQKAITYAGTLKARAFTSIEEMLGQLKPDGLVLVVNCEATPQLVEVAIQKRIPFLCEKPPATSPEVHRRLLRAVGDLPHVVGYNRRHAPYVRKAGEWLRGDRLVSVTGLFSRYRRREEFSTTAVHGIDTVLYLAGDDLVEARIEVAPSPNGVWNFFVSGWTEKNVRVDLLVTPDTAVNEEHYIVRGCERAARVAFPHHTTVDFPGAVELFERQRRTARLGPSEFGADANDAPELGGIVGEHTLFVNLLKGVEKAVSTLRTSLPVEEIRALLRKRGPVRAVFEWSQQVLNLT